ALLAIDPLTRDGIAVARYVALRDEPDAAEIAVTVADDWQGRGVGTALTDLLIARAREEGFGHLRAIAMGETRRAVRMLRRGGFRSVSAGGGLVELDLDL